MDNQKPLLYYIDGFHGGIYGHLEPGTIRDILTQLKLWPDWKVSFELEPASWEVERRRDPAAFAELSKLVENTTSSGRIEFVSPAYGQPYCWNINGESNIRQLQIGLETMQDAFPGILIDTYAVQEPCWTSSLPQIFRSLGFKRASLKDPSTAFGGYTAGVNASVVNWVGPEGTAIPAAPRYACEDLVRAWETESRYAKPEFLQKCLEHGIKFPAGQWFMDAGWRAGPGVYGKHIRLTTWREYFTAIVPPPEQNWHLTQEDLRVALPWGESGLQRLAREVRRAEIEILKAEKCAALAWLITGIDWPEKSLRDAWKALLLAQHHDAWIVGASLTSMGEDQTWYQKGEEWSRCSIQLSKEIQSKNLDGLVRSLVLEQNFSPDQWVRVFNFQASPRQELVTILVSAGAGVQGWQVFDHAGIEIPAQVTIKRRYDLPVREADETPFKPWLPATGNQICAAEVTFIASVPQLGWANYRLVSSAEPVKAPITPIVHAEQLPNGDIHIESDQYSIQLDSLHGGTIHSWVDKSTGIEWVKPNFPQRFNAYRGYWVNEARWIDSAESPAQLEIVANGPLFAVIKIHGIIGPASFETLLTITAGQNPVDFQVLLDLSSDLIIGEPWNGEFIPREQPPKPCYDDRYKLQACFPLPFNQVEINKNAAFDVCRSQLKDTHFNTWNEVKHTVILDWVDAFDPDQNLGLALFCDHTTGYSFSQPGTLGLILGWSGAGMWNHVYQFHGKHHVRYALLPHVGPWDQAGIWQSNTCWAEPLVSQLLPNIPTRLGPVSLMEASPGLRLSTLLVQGDDLFIRIFNAESSTESCWLDFASKPDLVELVELDGRVIEPLAFQHIPNGKWHIEIFIPRFGIRTMKCKSAQQIKGE